MIMQLKPVLLLSLFSAMATVAFADDVTVGLSDTPAAVQKTIQAQIGDGKMGDITKSAEDEDTVYDVDLATKDGSDRDFSVAQDGTLLSVEVSLEETPAAVQKTIRTELNGGDLDSVDKNLDDTDVSYDVEGTGKDGKEVDFTVDDDGTLSSEEVALKDTPDAVQKAIADKLEGGKVTEIDENFDDDGTNFDVNMTAADGSSTSFNVTMDGTLDSERIPLDKVPNRARQTIQDHIGNGTVLRVDKTLVRTNRVMPYKIEGRKDGKPYDFSVGPRGKFIRMDD
jgi:uncharacterized membrane protein YkoI